MRKSLRNQLGNSEPVTRRELGAATLSVLVLLFGLIACHLIPPTQTHQTEQAPHKIYFA